MVDGDDGWMEGGSIGWNDGAMETASGSIASSDGPDVPAGAPGGTGGRLPALEGVRGLAATMVVVHHAASIAGSGAVPATVETFASVMDGGVAVFFVLSGFLIYRPFARANLDGEARPKALPFLWRRAVRILPAYWLVLTFFWVLGNYSLGTDWWKYYLLLQSYSRTTVLGGLVQAWTLNTELAFYLLVPIWAFAIGAIARRWHPVRAELAGCVALALFAVASRAAISAVNPSWRGLSFQWLPTNLDLFAAGMALAVVASARDRIRLPKLATDGHVVAAWVAAWAIFIGYAVLVGAPSTDMLQDPFGAYRGWYWQVRQLSFVAMSLLLLAPLVLGSSRDDAVHRLLRWRPVAFVGLISYGLYLWHFDWMQRAVDRVDPFTGELRWEGWAATVDVFPLFLFVLAVGMVVGGACATASWFGMEKPLLRHLSRRG